MEKETVLISGCLLGLCCRYDGKSKQNEHIAALAAKYHLIPVCPEQLGGLPTPRDPSEIIGECVVSCAGKDVTAEYSRGAAEALRMAQLFGCKKAMCMTAAFPAHSQTATALPPRCLPQTASPSLAKAKLKN